MGYEIQEANRKGSLGNRKQHMLSVILQYFSLLVSLEQTWAWHSLSLVVGQKRPQWHRDRENPVISSGFSA